MGDMIQKAREERFRISQKWASYKGPWSAEKIKEMESDNRRVQEFCKEATKEWLHEKGLSVK